MVLTAYVVDAFTDQLFQGNPAAVVPLEGWLPDPLLQSIAAEHNLAETVYFLSEGDRYQIRWFTPKSEVDLCGHATLASAFVLKTLLRPELTQVVFESKSGPLGVTISGDLYTLDFPSRPPAPVLADEHLLAGLQLPPQEVLASRDYFAVYRSEDEIRRLQPDMLELSRIKRFAVIATAPSEQPGIDFVSRFFAPAQGVPEDPVTGSAHSTLIPYWAARLGKSRLRAKQISERGGELECELAGDRVKIGGRAVLYSKNEIYIPG
ncbi:PhzF family phenazine biosynthesis protein [Bryobacter aggregatus]|uniref:PhzF family phenazine biosynthesis protein n=1 Tax=Bryobacter aggregatus TaxID=360054 RepID=UPI0004E24794|nr:PhzF family phenazine biosynthesis protein [Bryobacter aggregatus]